MSDITISRGVRSNLLSLQNIASQRETIQGRLASGKKVNSALDNPTNFFTAASLNSRSNDLGALLDSMSNGIKTLEAADNGLKSITKTVESLQSAIRQARQDKSWQGESYAFTATSGTGDIVFTGGSVGTTAVTVAVSANASVDDVVASINGNSSLTSKVRASNDNGKLRIENLSTSDLTVTDTAVATTGTGGTIGGNTVRADLITQFNDLRQQLDRTAEDASFNGINLLRGDALSITFNETGSSSLNIQSKDGDAINSTNLGIDGLAPGVIADNIALTGIDNLTALPRMTRLEFESGAVLMTGGENTPCVIAGRMVAARYGTEPTAFPKAAIRLRGITAWVDRPGRISVGDAVRTHPPG